MEALQKSSNFKGAKGPVLLVIMDGVGLGKYVEGDLVQAATTPHLNWLREHTVATRLKAHGKAVGMPSDEDMGNSEIGHNAIGCGRVFDQGASLVGKAIESRSLFAGEAWRELIGQCVAHSTTLHFIGLFSDGNVHSHISHLEAMLREAKASGVKKARVHILLDGRDVPPTSALTYVDRLEALLKELNADSAVDYAIASGGGRMKITMDRYEADWNMVKLGWDVHVRGQGPAFPSARAAIEQYRAEIGGVIDQDLPPFVVVRDGQPIGPITDGDSVIYFNFRGDRAIEISRAFEDEVFTKFDREPRPKVLYAGMMQYDGDTHLPKRFFSCRRRAWTGPWANPCPSGSASSRSARPRNSGHVTYFLQRNRSGTFDEKLEDYVEIPSERLPFEQRPWMTARKLTTTK
jgi:2,3-bisphosphoglycerate-independent phosphoglycerate mutase